MKLKPWLKNIISMVIVAVGGFILFNLAFILMARLTNVADLLFQRPQNLAPSLIARSIFLILLLAASWFVFRSKWSDTLKAAYMTLPLIVTLVMIGMTLHPQPDLVVLGAGALVITGVLFWLIRKKLPWIYYFALGYVAALALYVQLARIDI